MPRVLVTDGEQRAALAVVRSLGQAGYDCVVSSGSGRSLAGASRFARRDVAVGDPGEPAPYVAAVRRLLEDEAVDLLIPITEASLLALLPARESFRCRIPFPSLESVRAICDKARVLELAGTVGIRVPRQKRVERQGDPVEAVVLPVVLKPTRSVYTDADGRTGRVGVRWARSAEELRAGLAAYPASAFPVLIQEAVEGPGIGIFVLLQDHEVLARFSHRRLREKPPSGGVSVLRRSEPMDEELLARSVALLQAFDWSGVAMVEYKQDERTGEAVLMEINGRFWGSLQLAIDAGVDFPRLLADVSFGKSIPGQKSYSFVRSRWFWGDTDHLLAVMRGGSPSPRQPIRALSRWLRPFGPGYRSEVFRWSDPRPFMRESISWVQDVIAG